MEEFEIDHDTGGGSGNAWMVIFTDLISLLLAFFVLLFSMSSLKIDDWDDLVNSLSNRLNPDNVWTNVAQHRDFDVDRSSVKLAVDISYLQAVVRSKTDQVEGLKEMTMQQLDDRLVLSLPGALLFSSGSANLSEPGRAAIGALVAALNPVGNQIDVVGYSDPNPVTGAGRYRSNWDLSLSRAVAVARAMKSQGYDKNLQVFGRADGPYYDISTEIPIARRMILARRVDLIIREDASGAFGQ